MSFDPQTLRAAFGRFLTGVTVVTTRDADGTAYGFTANSFTSVSMDPPLLLVCPGKFLSSFDAFANCSHFAINILAEGQEDIANTFAGYKGDRFARVAWSDDCHGVPVIDGAIAQFSCSTHQIIPAGDHIVLMGQVRDFCQRDALGLGYSSGRFFSLGMERDAATAHPNAVQIAGAIIEYDGKILMQPQNNHWSLPQIETKPDTSARQSLLDRFRTLGLQAKLGKVFSIYTDRATGQRSTFVQAHATAAPPKAAGTLIPIADLDQIKVASPAQSAMLARYAIERTTGHFNLYVGDDHSGDIHYHDERP